MPLDHVVTRTLLREDDRVRLALTGEIDLSNSSTVSGWLSELVGSGQLASIVVDLARLTFLDSTGVRTLIEAKRHAADAGVHLRLENVSDNAQRVLTVTGVYEYLTADRPA